MNAARCPARHSRRTTAGETARASPTASMALMRAESRCSENGGAIDQEGHHPHAGEHHRLEPAAVDRDRHRSVSPPSRPGMRANSSLVKATISEIIQCPETSRAIADRDAFGTKRGSPPGSA